MVFVVGVGWRYGLGHLGVPWGWVSWGVRRWGCGLGLYGVLVTLGAVFLAAACGAAGDACAGGRRLPAWRPYCSGVGPGGGLGFWGRSASGLGLRLGLGGLGPGCVPPEAWVGACAWARLWCGGLRCIGASACGWGGGGPIEAG